MKPRPLLAILVLLGSSAATLGTAQANAGNNSESSSASSLSGPTMSTRYAAMFSEWRDLESREAPQVARIMVSDAADIEGSVFDAATARRRHRAIAGGALRRGYLSTGAAATLGLVGVNARNVSSGFGMRTHPLLGGRRRHLGVDIAASTGTPVAVPTGGIVSAAGWYGGYGLYVAVEHPDGVQTRYGHLSRIAVSKGQSVAKGQIVGFVGSTGRSTGPHLHYETRVNGVPVNPLQNGR